MEQKIGGMFRKQKVPVTKSFDRSSTQVRLQVPSVEKKTRALHGLSSPTKSINQLGHDTIVMGRVWRLTSETLRYNTINSNVNHTTCPVRGVENA